MHQLPSYNIHWPISSTVSMCAVVSHPQLTRRKSGMQCKQNASVEKCFRMTQLHHIKMNTSKPNDFSINYSSHPISYDYPVRDSLYIVIPLTVIYSLIFLTGMVGNVITCVVISRNKSMHTATNYYLFSLAVSDLLLLLSGKTK